MKGDLFIYPQQLPEPIAEVPLYRTTPHKTYAHRLQTAREAFSDRLQLYSRLFNTQTEPRDKGGVVLFQEADYTLEVYRPSDSLRWTCQELAYRNHMPAEAQLPTEQEALELATNHLREYRLDTHYTQFKSIAYSELSITNAVSKKTAVYRTEINVLYNFKLEGHPIFGPGAKIKLSFVEGGRRSRLLYFWRVPQREKMISIISPEEALKKFSRDRRFRKLSPDTAGVNVQSLQFGYYALPPTEFQRFLIPVYRVEGTVKTECIESQSFTLHVVAVNLTPEQIMEAGVVANPASCTVF
jgi:hypothetical protein